MALSAEVTPHEAFFPQALFPQSLEAGQRKERYGGGGGNCRGGAGGSDGIGDKW